MAVRREASTPELTHTIVQALVSRQPPSTVYRTVCTSSCRHSVYIYILIYRRVWFKKRTGSHFRVRGPTLVCPEGISQFFYQSGEFSYE